MAIKKSEEPSIDYEFIKKYIRDSSEENEDNKENLKKEDQEHLSGEKFETSSEKVEFNSSPISEAKQEFIKHLEDESLSIDTCSQINRDWKRK